MDYIEYVYNLSHVDVTGIFSTFQQNPEMDKEMLEKILAVDAEHKKKGIKVPIRSMASTDATFHNP